MNVYTETNFVLELALLQEEHSSCESIVELCESGAARLILPAYSLAEPYETLGRRHRQRKELKSRLDQELGQLGRTTTYAHRASELLDLVGLLIESAAEESRWLEATRNRLLKVAEIVPLDRSILEDSSLYQTAHDFSAQDALVYATVLRHLGTGGGEPSCFLNRNSRDFDDPDVVAELERHRCKMIPRFDAGYRYIARHSGKPKAGEAV